MRSLFDRIAQPAVQSLALPDQVLSDELASVEAELNRLLNTRSYIAGTTRRRSRTVVDYGLDSIVNAGSTLNSRVSDVVEGVKSAIDTYEPRLENILVRGVLQDGDPTKLLINVKARLRQSQMPIHFQIPIAMPTKHAMT